MECLGSVPEEFKACLSVLLLRWCNIHPLRPPPQTNHWTVQCPNLTEGVLWQCLSTAKDLKGIAALEGVRKLPQQVDEEEHMRFLSLISWIDE